jgi:hypothetical protein
MANLSNVRFLVKNFVLEGEPDFYEKLATVNLEDLVAYAESESDMNQSDAEALRTYVVVKLALKNPTVFGRNAMKRHYRALLSEEEYQAGVARRAAEAEKPVRYINYEEE